MKSAKDQSTGGMKFDGMEPSSTSRSTKFAGNKWSGHSNDGRTVQKTQAPNRTGNDGSCDTPRNLAASVTRDSDRRPMTSPMPRLPAQGTVRDNINRGSQYRGVGGTMPRKPSDPDSIRVKQSGGPDYGAITKGSRPDVAGGRSNFNYGPKSQY